MTSPLLYTAIYLLGGAFVALGLPFAGGKYALTTTGNPAVAAIVAVVIVFNLMALSVAIFSLYQYIPDSHALGPSFLAGWGILTLGMLVVPIVAIPGLVWLYILPFDEQGHLDRSSMMGFDPELLEAPHHA